MDPGPSPTQDKQSEEEDVELELGGGDWEVGYDFVDAEDGPQWHIWMYGEVYIVKPDDPTLASLLDAFRDEADKKAQALRDIESADSSLAGSVISLGLGLLGVAGGGTTAVFSCAAVPLTFWAMGGTGWTCAGGVGVTLAGAGLVGLSIGEGTQAWDDRVDADSRHRDASDEVEELFGSIRDHISAQP